MVVVPSRRISARSRSKSTSLSVGSSTKPSRLRGGGAGAGGGGGGGAGGRLLAGGGGGGGGRRRGRRHGLFGRFGRCRPRCLLRTARQRLEQRRHDHGCADRPSRHCRPPTTPRRPPKGRRGWPNAAGKAGTMRTR